MFWRQLFAQPARGSIFGLTAVFACWLAHNAATLISNTASITLLIGGTAALFLAAVSHRKVPALLTLAAVLAIFYGCAHWRAAGALSERISPEDEGQNVEIIGYVDDLPVSFAHGVRFGLRVQSCLSQAQRCQPGTLYRLGWYFARKSADRSLAQRLQPGVRLQVQARLKQVHAMSNPNLFDAELRALEDGVAARGYVRTIEFAEPSRLSLSDQFVAPMLWVHQVRFWLRTAINRALKDADPLSRAVVVALVIGDQSAIGGAAWERFNRTGIGHLISISGLHITMLAGFANALIAWIWRSRQINALVMHLHPGMVLPGLLPTPVATKIAAVIAAFAYSALAGWGIPAQRTCWMLSFALLASLTNRASQPLAIVAAALLPVLLIDPWAVLAAGFWLSFAAVMAIVWYGSSHHEKRAALAVSRLRRSLNGLLTAARAQWAVTVALVPLGAVFFSSISLISPLANSVAIPIVSFIVTPLALVGAPLAAFSPVLGRGLLLVAAGCFEWLHVLMRWLDRFEHAVWIVPSPDTLSLWISVLGIAVLLSKVLPARTWAVVCLLPVLAKPADQPVPGELWVTALDVGQGMAVLVETAHGRMLYDAGPSYNADSDAGQKVVAPYLRSRGIDTLELLAISHNDSDHSGGAASVLRSVRVERMATSAPLEAGLHDQAAQRATQVERCLRGQQWRWGEVHFEWLHPSLERNTAQRSSSNAQSCVLRISSGQTRVLLTGDIEAAQERLLLETYGEEGLAATVLLVPHHGSKTSSSAAFIRAVAPKYAIFQVGYRNRFRHPHPAVWARYEKVDATLLRSDWHGAVQLRLGAQEKASVTLNRIDRPRYWRICAQQTQCPAL